MTPMALTNAVVRVWKYFFSRSDRPQSRVVHLHHCAAAWAPDADVALELAA